MRRTNRRRLRPRRWPGDKPRGTSAPGYVGKLLGHQRALEAIGYAVLSLTYALRGPHDGAISQR